AFTQPVSDTVMAYLLAFSRGIFYSQRKMAAGKWEKVMGKTPGEQTLGIIGIGNIGSEVARKAKAFGMKLLGNDIRTIPAGVCESLGILMVTLDNLLENADVVSINCDLNPSSYHLLGQKEFKRMKNTAILINTARGPIVNETELIRALQQERIAGAALDVFEKEPLAVNSPLRKMDNVLLAAHNSNSSPKYWRLVHEKTIAYLLENLA
ncbi:MAG: hypothetical protein GY757_45445, partial [bacterium]|nr:hypothetical protein [bacterium]